MQNIHCLLAAVLLFGAPAADAQVRLQGRVIEDSSEQPIAGATVVLYQNGNGRRIGRQVTDATGHFGFVISEHGRVQMQVEHIGYRRTTTPALDLGTYTFYRVEVRMDVEAVLLAPLEVMSRSRSDVAPTLAGFEQRRASGLGWFVTRREIEQRNPSRVSDLLATAPGVAIQRRIVFMARAGSPCPAQIYVDGFHINRSIGQVAGRRMSTTEMFPIDDLVKPGAVHGVEVYAGISRVPLEFLTPEATCGVVAIWTRRGD
jgi:hypothetical protein